MKYAHKPSQGFRSLSSNNLHCIHHTLCLSRCRRIAARAGAHSRNGGLIVHAGYSISQRRRWHKYKPLAASLPPPRPAPSGEKCGACPELFGLALRPWALYLSYRVLVGHDQGAGQVPEPWVLEPQDQGDQGLRINSEGQVHTSALRQIASRLNYRPRAAFGQMHPLTLLSESGVTEVARWRGRYPPAWLAGRDGGTGR